MAAQKGKDLLLRIANDVGQFIAVAGLRARQIAFNAQSVDVTHAESSGRWRELLAGAGVRSASITGAGVFRDDAADLQVRTIFFDDVLRAWRITIPDFGHVEGPFYIASLEYRGEHDGEVTFEIALESAGALTFEAI